jgi:uncharacterized protein YbjT (DUF2867 family)
MTRQVLVTGGTGTLGSKVAAELTSAGCAVRVLTRREHRPSGPVAFCTGDLLSGSGLRAAVAGAEVIVHCASDRKGDAVATRNLIRAASAAADAAGGELPHLVYISIAGSDRVSFGYFRSKRDCEQIVADSRLPWTTLRATQFYDLILTGARVLARLPVVPVPAGFVLKPVDAGEVASRLAGLARGEPAGLVPDMGGPQILSFADIIRGYLHATGRRRPVVSVRMPGIRAVRAGGLLPSPGVGPHESTAGTRTRQDFLAVRAG